MDVKNHGSLVFIVGKRCKFAVIITHDGRVGRFTEAQIDAWFSPLLTTTKEVSDG